MAISERKPIAPRLLVRPSPLKGEGLRGYLMRVGEANGQEWGANVWRVLTGNHNRYHRVSEAALDNVADALGLSRDQVAGMSYQPAPDADVNASLFFGHQISRGHLRRKSAVCPRCLAEQNVISGLWELNAICACPQHGTWLIDQCPACGEPFNWNRPRVSSCQCGLDLRTARAEIAPPDVLAMTSLLHDLALNNLPTLDERSLGYPPGIRQLSLNEMLGLVRYAEKILLPGLPGAEPHQLTHVTEGFALQSQSVTLLSRLLKRWPNKFLMALACFHASDSNQVTAVLRRREFNRRYQRMLDAGLRRQSFCQTIPGFVSQALAQFFDEHRINDHLQGRYLNPSAISVSANKEREIKLSHCLEALLAPVAKPAHEEAVPFSTFLLMKEKALREVVPRSEAPQYLGCHEEFLLALVDCKMLHAWNKQTFHERSLKRVLSTFEELASNSKKNGLRPDDLLPLTGLPQTGRYPSRRLIRAVTEGQVITLYKKGRGAIRALSDLYVAKSDIQSIGEKIWLVDFWKVARWS